MSTVRSETERGPDLLLKRSPSIEPYHTYDVLPPRWIRLLRLTYGSRALPDKRTKPLYISMISVPLGNCPDYVALSYTWGAPTWDLHEQEEVFILEPRCYPIHCAGKLLLATRNLRDALNGIRFAQQTQRAYRENLPDGSDTQGGGVFKEGCHLWIDALCIDQSDLDERAQQVALMGDIYKKAKSCLIWLGDRDTAANTACHFAMSVSKNRKVREYGSKLVDSPINRHLLRQEFTRELYALDSDQAAELAVFYSRKYYSRLWVVQEAVLAPDALVMCGGLTVDLEALLVTSQAFASTGMLSFWSSSCEAARGKGYQIPGVGSIGSCSETHALLTGIARCRANLISGEHLDSRGFMDVIAMTAKTQATDPRDRIYAIMAITEALNHDGSPVIMVDYKAAVEEVYVGTTQVIARRTKSLEFLYRVTDRKFCAYPELPSWCPDYSASAYALLAGTGGLLFGWHTGHLWTQEPYLNFQDSAMHVPGFCYDMIRDIGNTEDRSVGHLLTLTADLKWLEKPFCLDGSVHVQCFDILCQADLLHQ